jgi:hypothetical protein
MLVDERNHSSLYALLWLFPAFCWTWLIAYACFAPSNRLPDSLFSSIPQFDKLVHFGLFAVYAALVYAGCYRQLRRRAVHNNASLFAFWLAFAMGVVTEAGQGFFVESRTFDAIDLFADAAGAAAGLFVSEKIFFKVA